MGREEYQVVTLHPFGNAAARSGGTQWSVAVNDSTGSTAAWVTVEKATIEPPARGKIKELEFGITWRMSNSSTGSFVNGRIVGRNKDGTYTSLIDTGTSPATGNPYVALAADCTTATTYTYAGYVPTTTLLDSVPFDIEVQIQREGTTGVATGSVKNSSYVKVTYR